MFVKATNGQVIKYPYTVGDLRRENSNTSFPKKIPEAAMAAFDMYPVGYQAAPDYDPLTQRLQHSSIPSLVDGEWKLTKTVVALTDDQIAAATAAKAKEMRTKRDALISATDYFALTDVTMDAAMTTYRQALRDISTHENFPYLTDEDWPVAP